jgi:hypothetical protein
MRFLTQRRVEAALAIAVLTLLAVLLVPWREAPLEPMKGNAGTTVSAMPAAEGRKAARAAPEAVLSLFIGRAPAAQARTTAAVEKKPMDAPWLNYLGYYAVAEGKPYYWFKDTRTGRVIKVSKGQDSGEWVLLEISGDTMLLKCNNELYTVNKR